MSSQINLLQTILNSPRTVFTVQSLLMMSGLDNSKKITKSLHYYTNNGKILNPRKGVYTKLKYDEQEMACSLYRPSYISLEYVLQRAGVVFQWDDSITCISYLSRTVEIDNKRYQYRKINSELWIGMEGIEHALAEPVGIGRQIIPLAVQSHCHPAGIVVDGQVVNQPTCPDGSDRRYHQEI